MAKWVRVQEGMTLSVFVCPDVEEECGKGGGAVRRHVPASACRGRGWASVVPPGGAGAGSGPAPPQSSLLILPTARSSAAQACLAQRQGHRGCRAGQEVAPALPASSLQGPREQ